MSWSPARHLWAILQSNQADAPSRSDDPLVGGLPVQAGEAVVDGRALSCRHALSWSAASTLIPSRGTFDKTGQVVEAWATHTSTMAGSSDTDVNELTAMPTGLAAHHGGQGGDPRRESAERPAQSRGARVGGHGHRPWPVMLVTEPGLQAGRRPGRHRRT